MNTSNIWKWLKPLRLLECILASTLYIMTSYLGNTPIDIIVACALFITTGTTMLQNDWRDRHHDARRGKTFAYDNEDSFRSYLCYFWGLVAVFILLVVANNPAMGLAIIGFAIVALVYSEVRMVPGASILLVVITSGCPALLPILNGSDPKLCWLLFGVVVPFILAREIIQDIRDYGIDRDYKKTVPLAIGVTWSKITAVTLISVGVFFGLKIQPIAAIVTPIILFGLGQLVFRTNTRHARILLDLSLVLAALIIIVLHF